MYITFTITGKQAHGLGAPDNPKPYRNKQSGINTIERMLRIMNFLIELKQEFAQQETEYPIPEEFTTKISSVNLAEIHGGNKITTVPDKCYLHCSINTIPEQDVERIKRRIFAYIDDLKVEDSDLNVNVQIPISIEPFIIHEKSEFAIAVKRATRTVYNEERDFMLFMPSTDAHWFQERGIDTILIGASRADNSWHAADEFVYIEDLINTTKLYALTALNYLK
jgi:succinyl-diaminopimelate desuccinylase